MKTMYKFGFKIEEDSRTWLKIFQEIFDIDLSGINFETSYANKEKNWNETFKGLNTLKERRQFLQYDLLSIHCSFNRYQECVYLTLFLPNSYDYA